MKTYRFKTDANCSGCVKSIGWFLDKIEGIKSYKFDIEHPDHILEVQSEKDITAEIVETVKKAGWYAEPIAG